MRSAGGSLGLLSSLLVWGLVAVSAGALAQLKVPAPATPTSLPAPALRLLEDARPGQPVRIAFAGLPGNNTDWISVARAGSPDTEWIQYHYARGQRAGELAFDRLGPGAYEIRVYFNDSYRVEARLAFAIPEPVLAEGSMLRLAREGIGAGDPITAVWTGLAANSGQLIVIARLGTPDDDPGFERFEIDQDSGRRVFRGLPAGDYELRLYAREGAAAGIKVSFSIPPPLLPPLRPNDIAVEGLTNVALLEWGAFTDLGLEGEALIDGNAIDYDTVTGATDLSADQEAVIWLGEPQPIETVRFLPSEADSRTYRYRLMGSPDGVVWTEIHDQTASGVRGWQDLDLDGETFLAFRFVDLATDATNGQFPIVEFAAFAEVDEPAYPRPALGPDQAPLPQWVDTVPPAPINIASSAFGTRAEGGYGGEQLLDGILTNDNYWFEGGPVVVSFTKEYRISELRFLIFVGQRSRYRVEVRSADGDWGLVADRADEDRDGWQTFDLGGRPVQAVRITGLQTSTGSRLTINELEATTLDPAPATAVGLGLPDLNQTAVGNIALALYGGKVERLTSQADPAHSALHLIDGLTDTGWTAATDDHSPEVVLSFARGSAGLVEGVDFYRGDPAAARLVEIYSLTDELAWDRVGRFALTLRTAQRISFPPVLTNALRIVILETDGSGPAGWNEIVVREAADTGSRSLLPYRRSDFVGGVNLAALGGKVELGVPRANASFYPPEAVINGYAGDDGFWADENPSQIVVSFAEGQSALIGAVALHPNGVQNVAMTDHWPALFEIWVSEESPTGGFRRIGRYALDQADRYQVFAFEPVRARFVRLLILTTQYQDGAILGEFEILEAQAPGYESILPNPPNLLDHRFGGHVGLPAGSGRMDLIDSTTVTAGWSAYADAFPVVQTFGFWHSEPRTFDAVGINPKSNSDPGGWVSEVRILVSNHPLTGFRPVARFTLVPEDRVQYAEFPAITARFIQVRVLARAGGGVGWVSMGEIAVREARAPGAEWLTSRRAGGTLPAIISAPPGPPPPPLTALAGEAEPNDTIEWATRLPTGVPAVGQVVPNTDLDWYAIDTTGASSNILNFRLEQSPSLRFVFDLFDGVGNQIAGVPLYGTGAAVRDLTFQLPQGSYFARLSRPISSVAFIVDTSSSVDAVRPAIARAAEAFALAADPGQAISFMDMSGNVFNEFTTDHAVLAATARNTAFGRGGSGFYSSILEALDRLEDRTGERVIIVVSDGENGSFDDVGLMQLWARLAATDVRIYAIAYGGNNQLGTPGTGADLMRDFSTATGGRFYDAPGPEAIEAVVAEINADLRGDTTYRITAAPAASNGQLLVNTIMPVAGVSAPAQIALVLDASGSMFATLPDGRTRMDVAKEVMRGIIDGIPDNTRIALRIYGHRLPQEPKEQSCQDTELVVPFEPIDRARLHEIIGGIVPGGQTPIGLSLAQLATDFGDYPGSKTVILVTDGIESCNPNPGDPWYPPDVVEALRSQGLDIKVNIVGFGIPDTESLTRAFLQTVATTGGGQYFDAAGPEDLNRAIAESFRVAFVVRDSIGTEVARGIVGEPLTLPEGLYRVALADDPDVDLGEIDIIGGRTAELRLDAEGDTIARAN